MKILVLLVALAVAACSGGTHVLTAEQRDHEIDAVGTTPEGWAMLLEIAAGDYPWAGKLDDASELATRCRALRRLSSDRFLLPPQFIGSVYRRYSERLDEPVSTRRIVRLLDDSSDCDRTTIAYWMTFFVEGVCAVPLLRPELTKRKLVRAVARIDRLVAWHPSPAAELIEQAVAAGDVAAFRRVIAILARTRDGDRTAVSDTAWAAFDWLRALGDQSPALPCCGPLQIAIADGELGEELVDLLAVEPDREIRRAMWRVLATQPRPKSVARLREIADHEPDPDVKFEANDAMGWAKVGGTRVQHELERTNYLMQTGH